MAGVTRPVVVLAQEQEAETDYSHEHQSEAGSSRGVASNDNYGNITHANAQALTQEDNGTTEVKTINNYGGTLPTPDLSLTIYDIFLRYPPFTFGSNVNVIILNHGL